MYAWIWRKLPGTTVVKVLTATVLVLGVVALLLFVVFPWVEPKLPWNEVSVQQ
jgi:hypothetical protein